MAPTKPLISVNKMIPPSEATYTNKYISKTDVVGIVSIEAFTGFMVVVSIVSFRIVFVLVWLSELTVVQELVDVSLVSGPYGFDYNNRKVVTPDD